MGNLSSSPESEEALPNMEQQALSPKRLDGSRKEDALEGLESDLQEIPGSTESAHGSSSSSSSSSSGSEDEAEEAMVEGNDDNDQQQQQPEEEEEEANLMNPYEGEKPIQRRAKKDRVFAGNSLSSKKEEKKRRLKRSKRKESLQMVVSNDVAPISSECYRLLPIFSRRPSALVLHPDGSGTKEGKLPKQDEEEGDGMAGACFQGRKALTIETSSGEEADPPVEKSTTPTGDTSFLGCVASPISSKTNSWANLVGLEDLQLAYTPEELSIPDGDEPTPESDLRPLRDYWIVTTAALPWMTGTAVNPLLRAAYLSQRNRRLRREQQEQEGDVTTTNNESTVTLVIPWLEDPKDRLGLYGADWEHATPEIQEEFIRNWLANSAQMPEEASKPDSEQAGIAIRWYPARYHTALSSIFAMGDPCELAPDPEKAKRTICILEEPEHVNFYRAPGRLSWRDRFPHVIGIIHTNYKAYAMNHYTGLLTGPLIGAVSSLMVRAYCDKVVKLSAVLQAYAPYKEVVSNVHGIRHEFFEVPKDPNTKKIYFIGKLLWAKGLDKMLELEATYRNQTGHYFPIDVIGSGPEKEEIQASFLGKNYISEQLFSPLSSTKAAPPTTTQTNKNSTGSPSAAQRYWRRFRQPIPAEFLGRKDHAAIGKDYQIFVNPSITEVLCTTTAEAVAMGKWVIIPKHSSNEFFLPFSNCLQYTSRKEFVSLLLHCQAHDPPGWGPESEPAEGEIVASASGLSSATAQSLYSALSWEAATQRLIETSHLSKKDARRCERLQSKDKSIQEWHYSLARGSRGDVLRKFFMGGPVAEQSVYQANQGTTKEEEMDESLFSSLPREPNTPTRLAAASIATTPTRRD